MRIAILHYSAPPVVGGVESVIGHHARLFSQAGHTVQIMAGRGGSSQTGINFVHIPLLDSRHPKVLAVKSVLDKGQVPPEFSSLTKTITNQIRTALQNWEVLIAHNVGSLHKNLPLSAALMEIASDNGGTPLILWHHDLAWTTPRYIDELYEEFPWSILKTAWPGVKKHVVVSEMRRKELAALLGIPVSEIVVIPNGVDLNLFLKLDNQTTEIIASLDLLSAKPLLLLPVRITRRKNLELAIHTIKFLKEIFPDVRLLITGPLGPHNPTNLNYFQQLIALRNRLDLRHSVVLLAEISQEYLPDSVIADFYRIADGLFFTSLEEGFGIPILEAGISGLPIFCTDIPPFRELAADRANFFSINEDPQRIAKLIGDKLLYDRVPQMRQHVRHSYTWEKIYLQQIQPLLQEVLGFSKGKSIG